MAYPAQNLATSERPTGQLLLVDVPTMDFDTFYRLEFTSMVALARAICGDHQQAEDLAQEAMSRAHRNWHKVSTYDRPGAWLRRVTINLALSRRRKLQREVGMLRRTASQERDVVGAPTDPDEEIWEAVGQLPPRQRAAVALFYQFDQTTSEIADAMGCSVSTATSHLSQARARLAKILSDQTGGTPR